MRQILPITILVVLLGSCTSAYKSGQTPDDVYYSPARELPAYVETENNSRDSRRYDETYSDDSYLRMKSTNRSRWSTFDDDFAYWNNPSWNNPYYYNSLRPVYPYYGTGLGLSFYSGYNPWYNGYSYNPFCTPGYYGTPIVVVNPKAYNPRAYVPRSSGSLSTYNPRTYSTDPKTGARTYNISGTRSFSRSGSGGGYYNPTQGRSTRGYSTDSYNSTPSRSFNNGSSNSTPRNSGSNSNSSGGSRSGGSSGGSAPVRSFPRGG